MRHTARACSLARSPVRARFALDERGRWSRAERSGADASAIMRVYAGKWCPIILARGELRHRDGLPRILVEIMIDSRSLPICRLISSKTRTSLQIALQIGILKFD